MKAISAIWYRDPGGCHDLRYWDGEGWTRNVSDGGVQSLADDVRSSWGPPGAGQALVTRALILVFLGEPLATVVFLFWALFVVTAEPGSSEVYGWVTFAQMLPAVILMFVPSLLGFVWCLRASRLGAGKDARLAIWVSGAALAWALLITDFAGLIPAVFGDTWDWTGFPLVVAKIATAVVVTLLVDRAVRREVVRD